MLQNIAAVPGSKEVGWKGVLQYCVNIWQYAGKQMYIARKYNYIKEQCYTICWHSKLEEFWEHPDQCKIRIASWQVRHTMYTYIQYSTRMYIPYIQYALQSVIEKRSYEHYQKNKEGQCTLFLNIYTVCIHIITITYTVLVWNYLIVRVLYS